MNLPESVVKILVEYQGSFNFAEGSSQQSELDDGAYEMEDKYDKTMRYFRIQPEFKMSQGSVDD